MTEQSDVQNCPHIGQEFNPFVSRQLEHPQQDIYARARKKEPLFYSDLLGMWVVTRYEDVKGILLRPEEFSSKDTLQPLIPFPPAVIAELRKGYPRTAMVVSSDGEKHERLKGFATRTLTPRRFAAMEQPIRSIAQGLIDSFVTNDQVEIVSSFAYPLPLEVILTLIGVPKEHMTDAKRWGEEWYVLISASEPEERRVEAARNYREFQQFFVDLARERQAHPQDDMVSELVGAQKTDDAALKIEEMASFLPGLVLAGHETTKSLIVSGLHWLLSQKGTWQTFHDHPEHLPVAIEEILRYEPPLQGFARTTTREVSFAGHTFPEGTRLLLAFASANHDETIFSEPETLDIQRTPNRHLSFGHGIHFCIGAPLARLEARIAFELLSQQFPDLRLVSNQTFEYAPTVLGQGLKHLWLEWNRKDDHQ